MATASASFDVRIGSLSLRTVERNRTAEIVGNNSDGTIYVIASWTANSARDEWSLHFVCNRPFRVEREHFWRLAKLGQMFLDSGVLDIAEEEG